MFYLATSVTVAALSSDGRNPRRAAARMTDQHALGLRAGDALHLAIAADHGATVQTLDRRIAEAAPTLGIPARLVA